jgi:hypothetical protein
MHDRTRRIKAAIRYAKMRDSFRCRVCGRNEHLCGSHAAPRNVLDPTDPAGIITMCAWCDGEFGKIHSVPKRAEWLRFHRLDEFADWMAERDGRCA